MTFPDAFSSFVSGMRQPIEAFFHWLNAVTNIQHASHIRSSAGLFFHIFSSLALALCLLNSWFTFQAQGYPICWIDETKYGTFVNDEDVNLYYIIEAAMSRVSERMRFLCRKVKTEDLIDLTSAEKWMNRLYDQWPTYGRTLSTGRVLKKNAGEISLTILTEVFTWYHDEVDGLTIYTKDTDAHEFPKNAERILMGNSEFTPTLDSPMSEAFKSNDFILCQMYREEALILDVVRQLRRDDRKLTYTRQQADKSIICRKEVITKDQFIDLIQDATVQILL